MTAREKLTAKAEAMTTEQIVDALTMLNREWNEYTPDQRTVRSTLLNVYETRHGGDAVDCLMDVLDDMLVA